MKFKNISSLFILSISAATMFSSMASATVFYIDAVDGQDNYNGTAPQAAWKTVAKVNATAFAPGDSILFKRGLTWRETLTPGSSGSPGKPITYGAYGDESAAAPVISASTLISASKWRRLSINGQSNIFTTVLKGITKSTNNRYPNLLYVDNKFFDIAHYPNKGFLKATQTSRNQNTIIDQTLDLTSDKMIGATIITKSASWTLDPQRISSYEPSTHTITTMDTVRYNMPQGFGYYLRDKLWMLDSENEMYFDNVENILYIWLPDGDTPDRHTIEFSTSDTAINIQNQKYLVIQDITADKAIYANINYNGISNTQFLRVTSFGADSGIVGTGNQVNIVKSQVLNSMAYGINLDGNDNTLSGTLVDNAGNIGFTPYATPFSIGVNGNNVLLENNTANNNGYVAIRIGGNNITVRGNHIDKFCTRLGDCGGIYRWELDPYNTSTGFVIEGNVISNAVGISEGTTEASTGGHGIYLDDRTHDNIVRGNTTINVDNGLFIHNGYNNVVTGNYFLDSRDSGIGILEDANAGPDGYIKNIIISNNTIASLGATPPLYLYNTLGSTENFASFADNRYCHMGTTPMAGIMNLKNNAYDTSFYTLSGWKNISHQDASSTETMGRCTWPGATERIAVNAPLRLRR